MHPTQITVTDSNGVDGEVNVWFEHSEDAGTYDTPGGASTLIIDWKVIDPSDDFEPDEADVERALNHYIYK